MDAQQTSPDLATALLQWLNSFPLSSLISSWRDLEDGTILWRILSDIDSEYFHGNLPETDRGARENWIPRWQNLKYIDRYVTTYIRDECDKLHYLSPKLNTDLKAIATEGSSKDVIQLVKSVLLAAMYSARSNERMITVMQSLGPRVAGPIAMAIGEMEDLDRTLAEQSDVFETKDEPEEAQRDPSPSPAPETDRPYSRDPELEYEERFISAMQEKRMLEAKVADLSDELTQMRGKFSTMEEELSEAKFTIDRRRRRTMDVEELQKLTLNASRDKDYITELETDLAGATATMEQQERQLEKLKADEAQKQELRDELAVIRAERDELRQKSKANENLKKKIQAMQEQEKANTALRSDLTSANDRLQEMQALRDRCTALEKINEENVQAIANGEQEIFDQKTAKKRLEHEMNVLASRLEQTREALASSQDRNRELEDQLHDDESNHSAKDDATQDLDAELNPEVATPTDPASTKVKTKAEQSPVITAEGLAIQQNLSIATASLSRLEQRCLDLLQENLGYKAIVDDKEFAHAEDQAFQHQTKRLEEATKELGDYKSKYMASTSQLAEFQRRLKIIEGQGANGEVASSNIDDASANQERQIYLESLEAELRDQKALLRHSLLSDAALIKEDDLVRQSNEYRIVHQQLRVVHSATSSEADNIITSTAHNITSKIEQSRIAASQSAIHIDVLSKNMADLKAELEAEKLKQVASQNETRVDAATKQEMINLQRENKLIASAWYDITTRMQSNNVSLSRRQDPPRTMIGRARLAVQQGSLASGNLRR